MIAGLGEGSVDIINYVQKSGDATYFLALSYLFTLVVSAQKLFVLSRALKGRWEPSTLFLSSIVFASSIRFLSYTTLCILSFESVTLKTNGDAADDDSGKAIVTTTHEDLYVRVLEVLFNIGDFVFLTAYMMLVSALALLFSSESGLESVASPWALLIGVTDWLQRLVPPAAQVVLWADAFQQAKRHIYSSNSLKRKWLMAYLITVIILYILLITLYSLFLVSTTATRQILDAIYSILGFIDLLVPVTLVFAWCFLAVMYSGFPQRCVYVFNF